MGSTPDSDALLDAILRSLRTTLHACPEVAGEERHTAQMVAGFLRAYDPDELVEGLGGHGLAAVFGGEAPGPTVMVRADLDALEIEPPPDSLARAAHRCGHDGHSTIVCGLAPLLYERRPPRGRVVLLFQPAEETGEGARAVLDDPLFAPLAPDYAVGFHNLPGQPADAIIARAGTFACASVGMSIELGGCAAHAGEPEQALSPAPALAALIDQLPRLSRYEPPTFGSCTITHAHLGEHSFGSTPAQALLGATVRANTDEMLEALRLEAETLARELAARDGLELHISWREAFPATRSDPLLVELLVESARAAGRQVIVPERAFRWSEDFGHFARTFPSIYFGLGVGVDAPRLHQPDYAFRDASILTGVRTLRGLVDAIAARA